MVELTIDQSIATEIAKEIQRQKKLSEKETSLVWERQKNEAAIQRRWELDISRYCQPYLASNADLDLGKVIGTNIHSSERKRERVVVNIHW